VVYQSSRGSGVVFRSTLSKCSALGAVTCSSGVVALQDVVAGGVSRQAQVTLLGLEQGTEYELNVDVQNGQAQIVQRIVVNSVVVVWKTQLWTMTMPVTALDSAMFLFGCSGVGASDTATVEYVYRLDQEQAATTTAKSALLFESLDVGVHTLNVYCASSSTASAAAEDPLPLTFVWEVIGMNAPSVGNLYYKHYTSPDPPKSSTIVNCPRPQIHLNPIHSSSQKYALVVLGFLGHKDPTLLLPACAWRLELDGKTYATVVNRHAGKSAATFTVAQTITMLMLHVYSWTLTLSIIFFPPVLAPLDIGRHVLRVFSSSDNADQPHPPAVVSWTVTNEKPWDQTAVTFKGKYAVNCTELIPFLSLHVPNADHVHI